jgi:ribonuclease R
LSDTFSTEIENEINQYSEDIIENEIQNRLDLRGELIFTIDPDDAKDYDDAVSLKVKEEGSFELGVHIADVSFFVPEKSCTDKEAFLRGTSIYMPGKSIPMLPNKLTTNICSLVENKNRLTFSIIINLSADAEVVSYSLHKSIIRSKKRLTYHVANELIKKYIKLNEESPNTEDIVLGKNLFQMNELAKRLAKKRREQGSIDFNSIEPDFELNNSGNVISIKTKELLDTNHLIEEFMLLANKLVTERINSINSELPFIYRVHDKPPSDKIDELKKTLKYFGYAIKRNKKVNSKVYQTLLENIKNDKNIFILNDIIIRSMAKAVYSVKNIGHFGLGFEFYTHFTSPIRRYPDLVVHRLLEKYILNNQLAPVNIDKLSRIAYNSSESERRAMEIEREAIKIKQIQFLSNQPEKTYNAIIYNVVDFGFFVEIEELFLEGLVHMKNLNNDYYVYEPDKYRIIGKRTKKVYKLGDEINVKIIDLDLEKRKIDFIPVTTR